MKRKKRELHTLMKHLKTHTNEDYIKTQKKKKKFN